VSAGSDSGCAVMTSPRKSAGGAAGRLETEGARLVLLGVPPGTEVGVDMNSWNVGEKFLGIRLIPPGIHFIYYSSVNLAQRTTAPRTGFWKQFGRGETLVKKWEKTTEQVVDVTEEDRERVVADLRNIEHRLGPYPFESWKKWISLSNHISGATLVRLEPLNKTVSSVADLMPDPEAGANTEAQVEEDPRLPAMVSRPASRIRYTALPSSRYPAGSSPADISRHSVDSSHRLAGLLASLAAIYGDAVSSSMSGRDTQAELLGETQFAFLCFLVGMNLDSFEQWKALVALLCRCDAAMATHSELFNKLIGVLFYQMQEVPEDFFVDIVSSNNFLIDCLHSLFTNGKHNNEIDVQLKEKLKRFENNVTKRFGWDFSEELEDEAPVVVEEMSSDQSMNSALAL